MTPFVYCLIGGAVPLLALAGYIVALRLVDPVCRYSLAVAS